MDDLAALERRGDIALLTLNLALWGELDVHFDTIAAVDEAVGAMVLRAV